MSTLKIKDVLILQIAYSNTNDHDTTPMLSCSMALVSSLVFVVVLEACQIVIIYST